MSQPNSLLDGITTAKNHIRDGKYQLAIDIFEGILKISPGNEEALLLLLETHKSSGNLEAVLATLSRYTQETGEHSEPYERMVSYYLNRNQMEEAESVYALLVKNLPLDADAHFNFAWLNRQLRKWDKARALLQRALALGCERKEEVWLDIASTWQEEGNSEAALLAIDEALKLSPDFSTAQFNKASLLEEQGDYEQAKKLYLQLAQNSHFQFPLIERLANMGALDENQKEVLQKAESSTGNPSLSLQQRESLHYGLGKYFNDQQRYQDAFEHYSLANECSAKRVGPFNLEAFKQHIAFLINLSQSEVLQKAVNTNVHEFKCPSVFVCGMFRSGSTLIEQVLSSHSELISGGEVPFFSEVYKDQNSPYTLAANQLQAKLEYKMASLQVNYLEFIKSRFHQRDTDARKTVIDKRPDNILHIGLIKALFPDAKFVITQRDILDNAISVYFLNLSNEFPYANRIEDVLAFYQLIQELTDFWLKQFPDSVFLLRYEDFVGEQELASKALFAFLGLEFEPDCLSFHNTKNVVSTASLWQVRKPLYTASVGRWQHYEPLLSEHLNLAGTHFHAQLKKEPKAEAEDWSHYWQEKDISSTFVGAGVETFLAEFWREQLQDFDNKSETHILDLCCGNGFVSEAVRAQLSNTSWFATDYSQIACKAVNNRLKTNISLVSDALNLPITDNSFDKVISQFGIEYAGLGAFNEVVRILKVNGQFTSVLHSTDSRIYAESKSSYDAILLFQKSHVITESKRLFRYLANLRGEAPNKSKLQAINTVLNKSASQCSDIFKRYGETVANGILLSVMRELSKMTSSNVNYEAAIEWLDNVEQSILSYAKRLNSMLSVAMSETQLNAILDQLGCVEYSYKKLYENHVDEIKEVGWLLVIKKTSSFPK